MNETFLLMDDDATVTPLTRCDDCGFLFRDIEKHVAESVTVPAVDLDDDEMTVCEGCGALVAIDALRPEVDGVPLCIECWEAAPVAEL